MMPGDDIEDQMSAANVDDGEICDSCSDEVDSGQFRGGSSADYDLNLIRIGIGNPEHEIIKKCFLMGMGPLAGKTEVVSVHKIMAAAGTTANAKQMAFKVFAEAVGKKKDGDANVKYGWYGGSKADILEIVTHGFSVKHLQKQDVSYGIGIQLVPSKLSLAGVQSAEVDEDGSRHILLCRIILGKSEVISADSNQSHPSSTQFDSGVDDHQNPKKFIIWSSNMNSHILPSYILSFKAPLGTGGTCLKPSSPWISFSSLISVITKSLDPPRVALIQKTYGDFRDRKIGRQKLVQRMREVAGDGLLIHIIKRFKENTKHKTDVSSP